MRIRSIKPEFWRSDDIDALDWHERLVFIGLWSYVDDNGVGKDKLASIAADLFAGDLSVDPTETLRRLSLALDALWKRDLIRRYEADGRRYLSVTNWPKHQLVKNPNKARYPLPTCDYSGPTETLRTSSVEPTETLPTGTGEQGSSGTEEQRVPATPGRALATLPPAAQTAQTLIAEWIDHSPEPPPNRVKGHVAKEVGLMLSEGIAYDRVRAGLQDWATKGLSPASLASCVNAIGNQRRSNGKQAETDDMFDRAMQRALAREAAAQ